MIPYFMAQRIINGKLEFSRLPEPLRQPVYEVLKESGMERLAGDYKPQ